MGLSAGSAAMGKGWGRLFALDQAKIGIQLYTFRKEIEKDFKGTLARISEFGFAGVETAFWPKDTSIYSAAQELNRNNLTVFSVHCELPVSHQKEVMLEKSLAFGCNRMVWHGWPEDPRYHTEEGTRDLAKIYNESNQFAKSHGLTFGIHNHWWEFTKQPDGHYPYQVLLEVLEQDIFFEIDTYWVKVAGQDPSKIVSHFGRRAPLLHIKDGPATWNETLTKDQPDPMVAVGQGAQDFPGIVKAANGATEWLIVEMDNCDCDVFKAVQESYDYLASNNLGMGLK